MKVQVEKDADRQSEYLSVYIENPFGSVSNCDSLCISGDPFYQMFLATPETIFQQPEREQEVLDFYENCPCTIPFELAEGLYVLNYKSAYYSEFSPSPPNFFNSTGNRMVEVHGFNRLNMQAFDSIAVQNLADVVADSDLTLGDRKIIRDIALDSFHNALRMASVRSDKRVKNLSQCIGTGLNEVAIRQLKEWGFRVYSPGFIEVAL